MASGTAKGLYALTYAICETASPTNCDQATATVTVTAYTITAAADYGRGTSKAANTPIASVLANDRLGGLPATTANVSLSFVSLTPANSKIRLDVTDGSGTCSPRPTRSSTRSSTGSVNRPFPANCALGTATVELSGK